MFFFYIWGKINQMFLLYYYEWIGPGFYKNVKQRLGYLEIFGFFDWQKNEWLQFFLLGKNCSIVRKQFGHNFFVIKKTFSIKILLGQERIYQKSLSSIREDGINLLVKDEENSIRKNYGIKEKELIKYWIKKMEFKHEMKWNLEMKKKLAHEMKKISTNLEKKTN